MTDKLSSYVMTDEMIKSIGANKVYQDQIYTINELLTENAKLKNLIRSFFSFLDRTEESENGSVFHPVTIGCSRAMIMEPLEKLLNELKQAVQK